MSIGSVFVHSAPLHNEAQLAHMPRITAAVFVVGGVWARRLLESAISAYEWQVVTFGSVEGFLACPNFPGPSCLVLDITLPCLKGPDLQNRLTAERKHMPIVLTTGGGDVLMTVLPMKHGSLDFVATGFDGEELQGAVRHAIDCSKRALYHDQQIEALRARYDLLSDRERQVMALVAAGLLNKLVGRELGISEITVKAHRGSVMRKLRARSLAELVKMAASLQLSGGQGKANHAEAAWPPV